MGRVISEPGHSVAKCHRTIGRLDDAAIVPPPRGETLSQRRSGDLPVSEEASHVGIAGGFRFLTVSVALRSRAGFRSPGQGFVEDVMDEPSEVPVAIWHLQVEIGVFELGRGLQDSPEHTIEAIEHALEAMPG